MAGDTAPPQTARRAAFWILWSTVVCSVLLTIALVLWFWLPRWAPLWVIAHTPWVEPAVRAQAAVPSYKVNEAYVRRLQDEWGQASFPVLGRLMASGNSAVRAAAATGVQIVRPDRLPAGLESRLCRLASVDEPFEVRRAAVQALVGTRSPLERGTLLAACDDRTWQVQQAAFDGLRACVDREVTARKLAALGDPSSDVRRAVIMGLGNRADDSQVAPLAQLAADDRDHGLRQEAVTALARIRTPAAVAALAAICADGRDLRLAEFALAALPLGMYGLEAEAPLFAALKRPEPRLRAVGAQLMGAALMKGGIHQSRYGYADLAKQLSDPEPWVRGQVAVALALALATAGSQPEVTEPLVAAFVDGRLPAPPVPAHVNRDGRFPITSAEDQFALMAKVTLSDEQRARLERARKAP